MRNPSAVAGIGKRTPPPPAESGVVGKMDFDGMARGRIALSDIRDALPGMNVYAGDMDDQKRQAYVVANPDGPGQVLEARVQPGTLGAGPWFEARFRDADEVWLSYKVRFGTGFQWEKDGGKLPGLAGLGKGESKPPMHCSTATPDGGFAARHVWKEGGSLRQYIYHEDKPYRCGDNRQVFGKGQVLRTNQWHQIVERVVMNTPGKANGVMQTWLDGRVGTSEGLRFRRTDAYGVNVLRFETYFGGSDSRWMHSREERIYYDDFRVWTP